MNTILLAFLPFAFGLVFAVLAGVTYGLPMAALLRDVQPPESGKSHMIWAWEGVIALLAAVITSAIALFPTGYELLAPELQPLWLVTGGLIVLRAVMVFGTKIAGHGPQGWRWILAVLSLAIPAMLIQNLTVLLTSSGDLLYHWPLASALGLVAVLSTLALWSGYFYTPGKHVREIARRSYLAAAVTSAVALPLALLSEPATLDSRGLWSVSWPIAVALVVGGGLLMWPHRQRYFAASAVLASGVGLAFMLILMPYYSRPTLYLYEASTNGLTQLMIAAAYVLVGLVLVPGAVLLYDMVEGRRRRA